VKKIQRKKERYIGSTVKEKNGNGVERYSKKSFRKERRESCVHETVTEKEK
jgi:hypothetical protein